MAQLLWFIRCTTFDCSSFFILKVFWILSTGKFAKSEVIELVLHVSNNYVHLAFSILVAKFI